MIITAVYDPKYWDVWFGGTPYNEKPKKSGNAKQWAAHESAEIVYNLAYFNMATYDTVNYVKAKGFDVGYGGITQRLTVSPGNVCGGYLLGISDGDVMIKKAGSGRTRNGIGITAKGNIIVAQSTTNISELSFCEEVSSQLTKYWKETVKLFILEDGGGSTQMYSSFSRLGIAPEGGRKVPTVTCLKHKTLPKIGRVLKVGCTGEDVRLYQMLVGGLTTDGSYGNACYRRTKEMQKELKACGRYTGQIDGVAGPGTLKAMGL